LNPYRCWKCKFVFMGHSTLPGSNDEICKRCGSGTRAWIRTPEDERVGTVFFDVSSGLVMRAGRDRQTLFAHGFYKMRTHDTEILGVDRYGDYIPTV
jgi:hypothetical protein